jgi:uncharacterized surface protein with fasciclin (FAS1) repeats
MKTTKLFVVLATIVTLMWACSGGQNEETAGAAEDLSAQQHGQASVVSAGSDNNIVAIAVGSPDHTTLVAAVQAAGLVDVLANNGPLTVFAPSNAAFDKLPAGTVEDLLKPENKSTLIRIIHNHAAPGTYGIDRLTDGLQLYMATGVYYEIGNKDGVVTINGVKVLGTIEATNGIVHVIDELLLPPEK